MNKPTHPVLREVAIDIDATGMRRETDTMGKIEVSAERYLGAQTQHSLVHFAIGEDRMPKRVSKKQRHRSMPRPEDYRDGKRRRSCAPLTR